MKDLIKLDHDLKENKQFMKRRKTLKIFMFFTRFLIFTLFIILFAKPFLETQTTQSGNPRVTILIDESKSMDVFDLSFIDDFVDTIKKDISVRVRTITSDPLRSNLGDSLVSHLESDSNIMLISDLQSHSGISLENALLHANMLNSTVSAINLKTDVKDLAVWIDAPDKAIRNQDVKINVHINKLNLNEYNLLIKLNDEAIYNARDNRDVIELTRQFDVGEHIIEASLLGEDEYSENNIFYKTISVVPRPKILYVTRTNSRLPELLRQHYDVNIMNSIPSDLNPYYAVIIEDMNVQQITNVDLLSEYVSEGNGLFVIGGMNSYDRGGYKQSNFETLLPVIIGRGDKRQGDSTIVILIDMSGTTQFEETAAGVLPLDVIKALAVNVIDTLNRGNKVGVIAFAIPDPYSKEQAGFGAVTIANMEPLGNIREEAIDRISRIDVQGQKLFDVGFQGAYNMLRHESGSRNVILISDGGGRVYQPVKDRALDIVARMAQEGITVYTVLIEEGRNKDPEFMQAVARAGKGIYFPASQLNNLKILFGEPEEKQQGDEMTLFILNPMHFITTELEIDAKVYGFNQVVPKTLARTLITTDSGEPALTEWNYGLGKVLSLTVFSGNAGLGQLLSGDNSRIITRSINYLIGDPERKLDYSINIPDTYINEIVEVQVISKDYPITDINLVKIRDNEYLGRTRPEQLGINTLLNKPYAVNYPKEFQRLGMNKNAEELVAISDGRIFEIDNTDEIINYIQTVSRRTTITKAYITWQILVLILIIYLFEVIIRKIVENRRKL
ncbi:MAG: VWA domain-containing protein [Candidatus Woesearchaeota archaeon]